MGSAILIMLYGLPLLVAWYVGIFKPVISIVTLML